MLTNHESFSNSSSTSEFKSPVILLFDLLNPGSHQDVSPSLIWAPQILRSSFISGRQATRCLPIRCGRFSLSSARRVSLDVWHQVGLNQNCLLPRGLPISCWFYGIPLHITELITFLHFIVILGPGTRVFPSLRGTPCDTQLALYQKISPFLELASGFSNLRQCALPWANSLRA